MKLTNELAVVKTQLIINRDNMLKADYEKRQK